MKRHDLRSAVGFLLTACLLTACGARTEETPGQAPTEPAAPEVAETEAPEETPATEEVPRDMLPGLDIAALENTMPEEDCGAFAAYLPVLRGEQTFRWVAGPYDGYPDYNWEPFDADMTAVRDQLWRGFEQGPPETLTLDRLAVRDIDGDGTAELVLLFQDGAYNYLVLHREEDDDVYGTSFYVRWFEGLQKNGVYWGAGGAGDSTYYRMAFRNGLFEQEELGRRVEWANGCTCTLGGETVTEADFDAWYTENMVGDVTWYAPDGSVIPENQ